LHDDRKRPLLNVGDRRELLDRLAAIRNPLYAEIADLRLSASSSHGSASMARHAGAQIARLWRYNREGENA
jgi:shikimate kinase